jgi:two-component system NtrC family response regulator
MTANPVLLLVDDDEQIREQMKWALAGTYQVLEASDRPTAIEQMRRVMPELILLDLGLSPDSDGASEGLAILREALKLNPVAKVIVITGNSDRAKAVAAIQGGAYDFIEKPVQLDVLKVVLQRAQYLASLERENRAPLQQAGQNEFEGLVGSSEPMQEMFRMIRRVGPSEVPVLITGESGTGKELVARAIHCQSRRKDAAFVAINCGAIPDTLIESELFGHEKGAFTGAAQQRKGRIEGAQGGTLFLDEIGEIPLALQVKLLRFLQDHEIQRLGGKEALSVNTRVIAATNVNLQSAISNGRFREDLYYRLCVVSISAPRLSDRRSDIPLLARTFLLRFADDQHKPIAGFSSEAMAALIDYSWPGNVRELENRVKRAVVMAEGKYITPENLELTVAIGHEGDERTIRGSRENREKELVLLTMEKAQGNISRAATELGISRPTLYQLLARYGMKKPKADR